MVKQVSSLLSQSKPHVHTEHAFCDFNKTDDQDALLSPENILLAFLFAYAEPLPFKKIKETLGWEKETLLSALSRLREKLSDFPFDVLEVAGGYLLATKKAFAPYLKKLLKPPFQKLNPKTLESLAIIAYRQPITRQEIEDLRGVNVDGSLETLLKYRLIRIAGRKEAPGRPLLYATTDTFLKFFGLKSLKELPEIEFEELMKKKEKGKTS